MLAKGEKCVGSGRCEECGRCNLYIEANRKTNLNFFPKDFLPKIEWNGYAGEERYGIAFDIGTTTVAGMLWNLNKNNLINTIAKTNPQNDFGADVISRITYSSKSKENLFIMKKKIRDCMNQIIDEFIALYEMKRDEIIKATIVGNTTMNHLFLGIDASSLSKAPFEPAYRGPVIKMAEELELQINPEAEIYILPNIAGHVGADIVGVLLASGIKKLTGLRLVIDIGTNGEMVLALNGRMLACSTAAGPAFEGAHIYQGMRASIGAIETIKIINGKVEIGIIGDAEPIGICGSGLIDAIAQMLDVGIITFKGNMINQEQAVSQGLHADVIARLRKGQSGNEFVLVWKDEGEDIVVTQKDIREVQLAKGAICGGIIILLQCMEVESTQLEEIMLAGAFGSYIRKESALRIGIIPKILEEKITHIGNAAGVGSCMALLSKAERNEAELQYTQVEHVDLALHSNFEREFLKAMYFPK